MWASVKVGRGWNRPQGMKWEEQKPWVGTSVCQLYFRATVSFISKGSYNIPFAGLAISSEARGTTGEQTHSFHLYVRLTCIMGAITHLSVSPRDTELEAFSEQIYFQNLLSEALSICSTLEFCLHL